MHRQVSMMWLMMWWGLGVFFTILLIVR